MNQFVARQRVWVDGKETNLVPAEDRGLAFGDGLFETMGFHGDRVPLLERHLQRLHDGARRLRIALDPEQTRDEILRFLAGAGSDDGVIKLIVTRGDGGRGYRAEQGIAARRILLQRPRGAHPDAWWSEGVTIRHCETRLGSNRALAGMKHLNRLEQVMARMEWNAPSIHEGLMLDTDERVICATAGNVFARIGGRWLTPPVDRCGVAGVMREWLLAHVDGAAEAVLDRRAIETAEAVLICNSVRGLQPVRRIGQREWPDHGAVGELARLVLAREPAFGFSFAPWLGDNRPET